MNEIAYGLISPTQDVKNYVLDTNVLLHDPSSLEQFKENHLCIPGDVLSELDKFKSEQTERGANARRVHRRLLELFADSSDVTTGVKNEYGGTIRVVIFDENSFPIILKSFYQIFPDRERVDHRILAACILLRGNNSAPVVLVTKDLNMQLKARAIGIECQDYRSDKVNSEDATTNEIRSIDVESHDLQRFASSGIIENLFDASAITNEYVLLRCGDKQTIPARLDKNGIFVKLTHPEVLKIQDGAPLKPLNLGQKCLIDALLNPDISLVTCYGHAGTGKTLVAVAAGLHETLHRKYAGITVSRPVVSMGEQLGFLPGTLQEKMNPWLQPIYDALDFLMRPPLKTNSTRKNKADAPSIVVKKPYDGLIESGVIEIEALCYIRGRSIPNRFFILDEAQQLTPREAKTIVTRMSKDSKLVMVGDPAQIDNPFVDSRSNGLVYTRNKMMGQPFAAHVTLNRGERSELAEAGAKLM